MLPKLNKTILMTGAGEAQSGGIQKAREMGCRVIAVDGNPDAPGLKAADISEHIDIKDLPAILALAEQHQVDTAMTVASEICLPVAASVNAELDLPGMRPEQAMLMTDKGAMRQAYERAEVPGPKFAIFTSSEELKDAVAVTRLPAVLKPVDNAGSRGVSYVGTEKEIEEAFTQARQYSSQDRYILEEFMPGTEVSVEAFVCNGKIIILTLSDKRRTDPPYLLDTAVMFPSAHPPELQEKIKDVAVRAIKSLGIDNCPIHMEQMISPEGPKVVEMAARGPGFKVFTDIIPFVTGVDVLAAQIQLPFIPGLQLSPSPQLKGACIRFLAGSKGTVKTVSGVDEARELPGVYDLKIYVKPGDTARELTCGPDRLGHVITFAESRAEACTLADQVFAMINIEISPDQ